MAKENNVDAQLLVEETVAIAENGQEKAAGTVSRLTGTVRKAAGGAQATAKDAVESVTDMGDRARQAAANAPGEVKETAGSMVAMTRKVLLAGVGAMALTKDEIEEFVGRLVERGEMAEQDGRKLIHDVLSRRRGDAERLGEVVDSQRNKVEEQIGKADSMLDARIEDVLTRLNVPSKTDIDALSHKISALATKVDALRE